MIYGEHFGFNVTAAKLWEILQQSFSNNVTSFHKTKCEIKAPLMHPVCRSIFSNFQQFWLIAILQLQCISVSLLAVEGRFKLQIGSWDSNLLCIRAQTKRACEIVLLLIQIDKENKQISKEKNNSSGTSSRRRVFSVQSFERRHFNGR